jgi:hypothetical protein
MQGDLRQAESQGAAGALSGEAGTAPGRLPEELPEDLIDATRYPIHRPESDEARALVEACRRQMADSGACVLKDFLLLEATARAVVELSPRLGEAFYCQKAHNPYLSPDDPALPAAHPRNRPQVSDVGALADDQIGEQAVLRRLYDWAPLRAFVASVLGLPALFPYADPLGSLNLNVFRPGQQLGWHFDNADFVVTLMLQPAEAGGTYEYLPWTRSDADENYDTVASALDGSSDAVCRLSMGPGALILFRGRQSLHRVTPVEGTRPRLVAVLSYDTTPGVMLTEHNRMLFYGRVA